MNDYEKKLRELSPEELDARLCVCAENGYAEIVEMLLEAGADVNADGGRPICLAAEKGRLETVKVLLAAGADVSVSEFEPFFAAAGNGYGAIVETMTAACQNGPAAGEWFVLPETRGVIDTLAEQYEIISDFFLEDRILLPPLDKEAFFRDLVRSSTKVFIDNIPTYHNDKRNFNPFGTREGFIPGYFDLFIADGYKMICHMLEDANLDKDWIKPFPEIWLGWADTFSAAKEKIEKDIQHALHQLRKFGHLSMYHYPY